MFFLDTLSYFAILGFDSLEKLENWSHVPQKIETFSSDVTKTLVTGASFTSHAVSEIDFFFDTLSYFASVGFDSLEKLENWSRSKIGSFDA